MNHTTADAHPRETAPLDGPDQHHDHPLGFCWHPLQLAAFDVLGLPELWRLVGSKGHTA
jgi:hypothetical protein